MALPNVRPIEFVQSVTTPFSMSPELNYEDITLIWADENINETFDCLDTKCRLNIIVNYFKVFTDAQETVNYIRSALNEHLFLIVSGSLGEIIISQINNESQLKFIYVFCMNKEKHSEWTYKYEKICGVFIDKYELFHHLTAKVRAYEKSLITINVFNRTCLVIEENSIRDYDIEENITLAWLQLFVDILLRMPLDKNVAKQDMIRECRLYYKNNLLELKKIDEFETDYCPEMVIHWYTRDSFVYRLVNKALRTLNINIIFKFRFLIIDLYQQLKQHHIVYIKSLPTINPDKVIRTVYRSQHVGLNEIEKLQTSVGNLICSNSFFSTTEDFLLAQEFVVGATSSECVLFQIDIPDSYYHMVNDTLEYTYPFLKLENLSQYESESEVIFSMGALFRIESVEKYDTWYVRLKFEAENDEISKQFHISEQLESRAHNWQQKCSVEDRILLLTEKLPQSCRSILNIYIKYGVFADENSQTSNETLTTYRKGFELIMKCLPDYQFFISIAMYLSIGLLYFNRGERILSMQFGETALHIAETCLSHEYECLLICFNYLAVIHQLEDQYTEALSIYERMLSIATEQDNTSILLAIYEELCRITCDFGDFDYELICLKKIAEFKRKLNCEDVVMTHFDFGSFYERKENFILALYYYKQHFRCLLQKKARISDLIKAYFRIGKMYENLKYYIPALQINIGILVIDIVSRPFSDHSLLRKYEIVIRYIQRLIKCNYPRKLRYLFQSLMTSSPTSIIFIKFIKKIKFLFYFEFENPIELKAFLNSLLQQALTEYHNQRMYENSWEKLQRLIERFLQMKPLCFAQIYYNAQILRKLADALNDYRRYLYLIQRAYFSTWYSDASKIKEHTSRIKTWSNDIRRVIHAFTHSCHATLCQDRRECKPRQRHRSSWIFQYRLCGCFKDCSVLRNRYTKRWARFSKI